MKHLFLYCLSFLLALPLSAQNMSSALIPQPNSVVRGTSAPFHVIEGKTTVCTLSPDLTPAMEALKRVVKHRMGITLTEGTAKRATIQLAVDTTLKGREHYRLEITRQRMLLTGASPAAVFYAVMTLDQLLLGDVCATINNKVSAVTIDDAPRFGYRALMLDPARHFLPVDDVKFFIDQMAKYKYNVLQLHLTDDQGWRIALRSHPHLADKQAYTEADLRELIHYAADRYIEIVPEIDIPGHTAAFLSVYKDLGCKHLKETPIEVGTTVNRMLCASNPRIYEVFADVLAEVAGIFPSSYIHLGGDEAAVPANWAKCEDCQNLMKTYGYSRPSQLMIPFFDRILAEVRKNGKKPILWCELNNIYPPADDYLFPYPADVTLVSWRNGLTPTCQSLTLKSGHPLIMAPGEYAYLDYPQLKGDLPEFNNWGMPVTTLEKTYQLDPGYGRPAAEQAHILGVMGTLWAEAMNDINRVTYMAYPRALALAEAGWTQMEHRSWESFKERIYPNLTDLMRCGVSVRVPFEIVKRNTEPDTQKN